MINRDIRLKMFNVGDLTKALALLERASDLFCSDGHKEPISSYVSTPVDRAIIELRIFLKKFREEQMAQNTPGKADAGSLNECPF